MKITPDNDKTFESHYLGGQIGVLHEIERDIPEKGQQEYLTKLYDKTLEDIKMTRADDNMNTYYAGRARQLIELGADTSKPRFR